MGTYQMPQLPPCPRFIEPMRGTILSTDNIATVILRESELRVQQRRSLSVTVLRLENDEQALRIYDWICEILNVTPIATGVLEDD